MFVGSAEKAAGDNDYYEYYYVYYDEEGNVVGKNTNAKAGAKASSSPGASPSASPAAATAAPAVSGQTKLQEIALLEQPVVVAPVATTTPPPAPPAAVQPNAFLQSDDKKPGDTPTIYAEIQNPGKAEADAAAAQEEAQQEGLTIFGIPIPKIPFSLSFGLAPTLSQGLIPLPIGRKGDDPSAADLVPDSSDGSHTQVAAPPGGGSKQPKPQRGPDSLLDPIWVETGLKAAQMNLRNRGGSSQRRKKFQFNSRPSELEKEEDNTAKREVKFTPPPRQKIYNYEQPVNPIIPLTPAESNEHPRYFPTGQAQQHGEYFPTSHGQQATASSSYTIPAIKFDHPVPQRPNLVTSGRSPVLPPADSRYDVKVDIANAGNTGSPRETVNGFRPLFRPNNFDPIYQPAAIQNQNKNTLPPGFKFASSNTGLMTPNSYPRIKAPAIEFTSTRSSVQIPREEGNGVATEVPYEVPFGVPFALDELRNDGVNPSKRTPVINDISTTIKEVQPDELASGGAENQGQSPTTTESVEYEYYEYEEEEDTLPPPPPSLGGIDIKKLLETFRDGGSTEELQATGAVTTERSVPTLQVEEVTLVDDVTVAHRGTSTTSSSTSTATATEPSTTTTGTITSSSTSSSSLFPTIPTEVTTPIATEPATNAAIPAGGDGKEEYEYYYYEYYEEGDEAGDSDVASSNSNIVAAATEQTASSTVYEEVPETTESTSLQTLLDLMKSSSDDPPALPTPRPTFPPPIRTTTLTYDDGDDVNGNYLESHRSSVTVDSLGHIPSRVQSAGRLVSTTTLRYPTARSISPAESSPDSVPPRQSTAAYPFHPDRLDPAQSPDNADKVKWYYNDYAEDGDREPYVSQGRSTEIGKNEDLRLGQSSAAAVAAGPILQSVFMTMVLGSLIRRRLTNY